MLTNVIFRSNMNNTNHQLQLTNFWKTGNYQSTVDRVAQGEQEVKNIAKMLQERAQVEQKYQIELQKWSSTWEEKFNNGKEYGSALEGIQATIQAAQMTAETHDAAADQLRKLARKNGQWRKSRYIKNVSDEIREALALKRRFESVQRDWINLNTEEIKAKNAYWAACQAEEQAERSGEGDLNTLSNESERLSQEYDEALQSRMDHRDKYVTEMESIFGLAQDQEKDRKKFVKSQLLEMQEILDTTCREEPKLTNDALKDILQGMDVEDDINLWNRFLGPASSNQIPELYE